MFDLSKSKLILVATINSEKSENFLLFIRIIFKETTKHKSLYLKINFTKVEPNTHYSLPKSIEVEVIIYHF